MEASFVNKFLSLRAFLIIESEYEIEMLGTKIARHLFNGKYEFGGLDEHIRDEVPAIYFIDDFLKCFISIEGYPGLYNLIINQEEPEFAFENNIEIELIDISFSILCMLQNLGDESIKIYMDEMDDNKD
jgi:hypothetical protein